MGVRRDFARDPLCSATQRSPGSNDTEASPTHPHPREQERRPSDDLHPPGPFAYLRLRPLETDKPQLARGAGVIDDATVSRAPVRESVGFQRRAQAPCSRIQPLAVKRLRHGRVTSNPFPARTAADWEIAYQGFGGAWYRLGWSKGETAASALRAWVEDEGRRRETYGVRSPGEVEWEPFLVDPAGAVYPTVSSVEDELRATAG